MKTAMLIAAVAVGWLGMLMLAQQGNGLVICPYCKAAGVTSSVTFDRHEEEVKYLGFQYDEAGKWKPPVHCVDTYHCSNGHIFRKEYDCSR